MRFLSSLLLVVLAIPASLAGCGDELMVSGLNQPGALTGGGQMFFDEFDGEGLDASWRSTRGSFTASGGVLIENSGQRFIDAQLLWEGGFTESADQIAKIQVVQRASHTWGFMFRTGGSHHYEVHLPVNSSRWRWELNDPDFVERIDDCPSDAKVEDGDWLGATAVGLGTDVVVSVWRWDSDPDLGGLPNPDAWGPPDCVMTGDPSVPSDELGLGIRSYTGNSTAPGRADHWAAGDIPGGECGNGIPEPGEECDEGAETANCDADCTLADCDDGIYNPLAEECEFDANCAVGQVCNASCLCEVPPPPPVCGNGILEPGEDCDDGGQSPNCDADCTLPMCGDGELNPGAGEDCEVAADCAAGELCLGCTCVVANGQLFSDDFDSGPLGTGWAVQAGSFSVSGGLLFEDSGTRFLNARVRWSIPTDTPNQFGKLNIEQVNGHSWGFQSRLDDSTGHHYEIHLPAGTSEWRWELYDPGFVARISQCVGDSTVAAGDWIGYTIDGSGPNTTVQVWRWDFDPDGGGVADPIDNWGAPDCVMQAPPSVDVALGRGLGIRSYTGGSTQSASIDYWTGGDLVGAECGNGIPEPGEACDDGGQTATCNADCTLAECDDGIYNPLAEECEFDANCAVGQVCNASCLCEVPPPPPVCGNGILEPGEDCDDGGQSPNCDTDCTLPMCGDGELNPGAGEDCEVAADCAAGELCLGCTCVVANGQLFSDDFDGAVLDPAWTVLTGSFSVSGGGLVEGGGSPFTNTQLLWGGGLTDTPDQYAKLQLVDPGVRSWGFIVRYGDGSGHHYEVHLQANSGEWRWELYDPDFVERVESCFGDQPPESGDWLGVAIEGAGADTKVSVWRWDADPDPSAPDPVANWGPPDCQMQVDPSGDVGGRGLGVRSYTGNATAPSSIDNWTGGDLLEPIPNPVIATVTLILDRSGAGTPNSMIDPDGIAADSAGNVYVAACGLSTASTGLFKITPSGDVTRLIDSTGDGVHPFNCGVGVDVDSSDNVYVVAFLSDNVFKVTPTGDVTQILDSSGAGSPNSLLGPIGVAVSNTGDVYVSAFFSDNVHKITPEGEKFLVLDSSGDGMGSSFFGPFEVDTDPFGNVFVAANESDNVFKITPAGSVSEIINASGDGTNPLWGPHGVGCDAAGNVYVTGNASDNVFRIEPSGTITQIMDINGDGAGNLLDNPTGLKATADGKVYVTAFESDNAFEWDSGTATQILTILGDGYAPFLNPADDTVAIGPDGELYMTGTDSDTVFRVLLP